MLPIIKVVINDYVVNDGVFVLDYIKIRNSKMSLLFIVCEIRFFPHENTSCNRREFGNAG